MKIKGFYCFAFIFAVMFICTSVSAAGNTTLIVHGAPFHNQAIWVLDPGTQAVLAKAYTKPYYTGIYNTTFVTSKSKVTLQILDRQNGQDKETYKDFGEYSTGGVIEISLPGAMNFSNSYVGEPQANITTNASAGASGNLSSNISEGVTIEESNETGLMSGFVSRVSDAFNWFSWKYVLYFLGIIVAIAVVVAAFVFGRKGLVKIKRGREDNNNSFEERKIEKKKPVSVAQRIADAEMKITEAQKELDELKDREIKKTERKLEMLKRLGNIQQRIDEKSKLDDSNQI